MPACLCVPVTPYNRMPASPAHAINRVCASPALFPAVSIKNICHSKNFYPFKVAFYASNSNIDKTLESVKFLYLRCHAARSAGRAASAASIHVLRPLTW